MALLKALGRFALALAACLAPWSAAAQQATEAAVKAALLFKFANYVEWPAEAFPTPAAPVAIGVLGSDEIAAELEQLVKGRPVNNRPVSVRRLKDGESLAGLHILFVAARDAARVRAAARAARPLSVLLISDAERGLEAGSVINFVTVEDRVGFEVSMEAAERSGLRLSSRMLGVARRVVSAGSP